MPDQPTNPSTPWRASPADAPGPASPPARSDEFTHPLPTPRDVPIGPGDVGRREFMGWMTALAAFAAAGCDRGPPDERIVPRARHDAPAPPGTAERFATSALRRGRSIGVLGEVRDGRPIKLEGNPLHPASLGATDAAVQAELLSFYHPARSALVRMGNAGGTRRAFRDAVRERLAARQGGEGFALLIGPTTSPTSLALLDTFRRRHPAARVYRHDPADRPARDAGRRLAVGDAEPLPDLDRARVIISLGDDFLIGRPDSIAAARAFASTRGLGRRPDRPPEPPTVGRLYAAEPVPTITGARADHRLPASPALLERLLLALAADLALGVHRPDLPRHAEPWLRAVAADAVDNPGAAVLLAGDTFPAPLQALALLINEQLRAPVALIDPVEPAFADGDAADLASALRAGDVDSLLLIDANPVYSTPGELGFRDALELADFVAHAGVFADETAHAAGLHAPLAHPLESWADARAFDGSLSILQPLIRPLYDAWTPQQLLAGLVEPLVPDAMTVVRAHHARRSDPSRVREHADSAPSESFDRWWRSTLRDGVAPGSASLRRDLRVDAPRVLAAVRPPRDYRPLQLVIRPDPTIGHGEHAHNQWLQELPKPITKLVWSNALQIAPSDAERLGLKTGDVVGVRTPRDAAAEAPVFVTPGHAEGCVSLTLGYGRSEDITRAGGVDAYALLPASPEPVDALRLACLDRTARLVTTQTHGTMGVAEPVRTRTVAELADRAHAGGERTHRLSLYPEWPEQGRQWGMSIDLALCIGCGACTVACQAENNIPWVGPDEVERGREMHWIRVDRYFEGDPADPAIMHQPVPCMHCENAPCEVVCPTAATKHSPDGLNEMVYNRCIGTRYCSNNCPYKVRRFNFHRYSRPKNDGNPGSGARDETLRLLHNPEVTVRARGVMEKCTYCVQRIRNAEINARVRENPLRDGDIVTACQQVCPTRAIVFGDVSDPGTAVSRAKASDRSYDLLAELNTRPRTSYLADVRNPSPAMTPAEGTA